MKNTITKYATSIKNELYKKTGANTIVTATYGIYDECGNGYNHFEFKCELWSTVGDKKYGEYKKYKNIKYYFVIDIREIDAILKYFPELINVAKLNGRDSFGVDSYPLMNGKYYLNKDIKYAAKYYMITIKEATQIANFNNRILTDYILTLVDTKYSKQVKMALDEIENTTGVKYKNMEKVSPNLYNDINYTFITKNNGWNVYKANSSKIKKYPKY